MELKKITTDMMERKCISLSQFACKNPLFIRNAGVPLAMELATASFHENLTLQLKSYVYLKKSKRSNAYSIA